MMKNVKFKSAAFAITLFGFLLVSLGFSSCEDSVKDGIGTIESVQVSDYLADPENAHLYSEFVTLIKAAGMFDLLNAYGVYTCFVPTNEAIQAYYDANETSFEELTDSARLVIVRNHIISAAAGNDPIETVDFPIGSISVPNMNGNFIRIAIEGKYFWVNGDAGIIKKDNVVHNGVVHTINKVLEAPSSAVKDALVEYEGFELFCKALEFTGLVDSLSLTENKDYTYIGKVVDQKPYNNGALMKTPEFCKYGYTVFMESDETLKANGIVDSVSLVAYAERVYYNLFPLPEDQDEAERIKADYTDRNNAVNRFVAYHMMNRMADVNEFINPKWEDYYTPGAPIFEYVEMMMPNSLIEVSKGNIINKNMYDASAPQVKILSNIGSLVHVMFHEIDNILTYEGVESNVLNKRLRMDCASMMPELITNKMRGDQGYGFSNVVIPPSFFSKNKVSYSEDTQFQYIGSSAWTNMYGDEMLFVGKYDVSITTPPIPPGRWEVRLGYSVSGRRGVAQIFLNGKPCGIPQDLRIGGTNAKIGWTNPNDESDGGIQTDKMMRNRGYMRASSVMKTPSGNNSFRYNQAVLRKIISVVELQEAQPLVVKVKSVMDDTTTEYMVDYMEFVPSSYIDEEGID
ncbi:putative surface protein with fasciclin (FAS1) repeats [Dysgonomonadaceae bacterium PH5-43]|nr:putative surface protein with fasciclin (FAS1) repeats [Dysgonomonadaceae bacterium PH5-43]